jgi:hypothetical protein
MDKILKELISEAISLEYNISDLYMLYYESFQDDEAFWWKLMMEEKNHASLLKTINTYSDLTGEFPYALIPEHLNGLRESNSKVISIIEEFKKNPDRKKAFEFAIQIEELAGEAHYQSFMDHDSNSKVIAVFKKLGREDCDHAQKIRKYMVEKGV